MGDSQGEERGHQQPCSSGLQSQAHHLRKEIPHLPTVLLRLIDDFLLITPSRSAATAFLHRLKQGERSPHAKAFEGGTWTKLPAEIPNSRTTSLVEL